VQNDKEVESKGMLRKK